MAKDEHRAQQPQPDEHFPRPESLLQATYYIERIVTLLRDRPAPRRAESIRGKIPQADLSPARELELLNASAELRGILESKQHGRIALNWPPSDRRPIVTTALIDCYRRKCHGWADELLLRFFAATAEAITWAKDPDNLADPSVLDQTEADARSINAAAQAVADEEAGNQRTGRKIRKATPKARAVKSKNAAQLHIEHRRRLDNKMRSGAPSVAEALRQIETEAKAAEESGFAVSTFHRREAKLKPRKK